MLRTFEEYRLKEQYVKKWQKRLIIIAVIVVVGGAAGWLTFNLGLDYLLGGRTFS